MPQGSSSSAPMYWVPMALALRADRCSGATLAFITLQPCRPASSILYCFFDFHLRFAPWIVSSRLSSGLDYRGCARQPRTKVCYLSGILGAHLASASLCCVIDCTTGASTLPPSASTFSSAIHQGHSLAASHLGLFTNSFRTSTCLSCVFQELVNYPSADSVSPSWAM